MSTLFSLLERSAARYPDKVALRFGERSYTYADLLRHVLRARTFFARACAPGDIVSLHVENSDAWIMAYFGILGAGLTANPLNPTAPDAKTRARIELVRPKCVVVSEKYRDKAARMGIGALARVIGIEELFDGPEEPGFAPVRLGPETFATLLFTSGTTAQEKAVRLRHRTVLAATAHIGDFLKIRHDDVYYQILPLTHSTGLGNVHVTFLVGGTVSIAKDTINLQRVLREIVAERATFFTAAPITLKRMVEDFPDDFFRTDQTLRVLYTGMAPISEEVTKKILANMPRVQFSTFYGLTEASRSSFITFSAYPEKLASVGRPTPGATVRIVDEAGRAVAEPGEIGEICIRGKHVADEYWRDPEATRRAFRGGWLHTGDMGYVDQDGFLYVSGRMDDLVNIGGEKVSLEEVDQVIAKLPVVRDVTCLAEPDEARGQRIHAYIVLAPDRAGGRSPEELGREIIAHCKRLLEGYKVPQRVSYCESVPRTESGKTQRKLFQDLRHHGLPVG